MLHADSRLALTQFLASGDPSRSVVITHHAPSIGSLPEHKRTEPISAAYASNLEDVITTNGPAIWVHGHIHHPRDYAVGNTRIVNNALGYPGSSEIEHRGFRGDLVLEL